MFGLWGPGIGVEDIHAEGAVGGLLAHCAHQLGHSIRGTGRDRYHDQDGEEKEARKWGSGGRRSSRGHRGR